MKSYQADLMLLMVTIFWGTSCLLTKIGLGGIEEFNLDRAPFRNRFYPCC